MPTDSQDIYTVDTRITMYNNLPKGGVGAEIGVCKGANAAHLWLMSRPKVLHLVDLWERNELTEKEHPIELHYNDWRYMLEWMFPKEIESGEVVLHKKNSTQFLEELEDGSLDWVYLDGEHSFINVVAELKLCARKVKKGGVIAGHDFISPSFRWCGVPQAVLQCVQEGLIRVECLSVDQFSSFFARVL